MASEQDKIEVQNAFIARWRQWPNDWQLEPMRSDISASMGKMIDMIGVEVIKEAIEGVEWTPKQGKHPTFDAFKKLVWAWSKNRSASDSRTAECATCNHFGQMLVLTDEFKAPLSQRQVDERYRLGKMIYEVCYPCPECSPHKYADKFKGLISVVRDYGRKIGYIPVETSPIQSNPPPLTEQEILNTLEGHYR